MKIFQITALVLVSLLTACSGTTDKRITRSSDYQVYLEDIEADTTSKYFRLWNSKIKSDSLQLTSLGHVAAEYNRYFKETGDVRYLKKAEKALEKAVAIANVGKADYHRALARNYISQHRFREGLEQADAANTLGSGKEATQSLYFDLHMELGNYEKAEAYLDSIKNFASFGYLIRLAKWNDFRGDLDTTIRLMEQAAEMAEQTNNPELQEWAYANLGDYYGHAGRIEDSYQHYLKTLKLNPSNAHVKKGIAWIAYAHDTDVNEARRILLATQKYHGSPDHDLFLAELAEFDGDEKAKARHLDAYLSKASTPEYGIMYNIPNIMLHIEELNNPDLALELATREVAGRPTPETYGALAYAYLHAGNAQQATAIVDSQIIGKTYEPAVLLQAAEIFKAYGKEIDKYTLKDELLEATYELGPVTAERVRRL